MQKILNDMNNVYKKMEKDFYSKYIKFHKTDDYHTLLRIKAKLEVIDFLLWYLKEGELNG
jgi:hypothetical protein